MIQGPILINSDGTSNKFWTYTIDAEYSVHTKWGRVGSKGLSKTFKFNYLSEAESYAQARVDEKIGKGYNIVQEQDYQLEVLKAGITGARAKIDRIFFLQQGTTANRWRVLDINRPDHRDIVSNPEYKPHIWCAITFTGDGGVYDTLIEPDGSIKVMNLSTYLGVGATDTYIEVASMMPIEQCESKLLKKLGQKIPEAIACII